MECYKSSHKPISSQCTFSYPLENIKKHTVFRCFQGVEKGCIGNKWVNMNEIRWFQGFSHQFLLTLSVKKMSLCDLSVNTNGKSAKLRALHCVLACQRVLRAYVPCVLTCLRGHVPTCLACLLACV